MRILRHPGGAGVSRCAAPLLVLTLCAGGLRAQEATSNIYRDGRTWVEETQGTVVIPGGQQLHLRSHIGRVLVRIGPAGEVRYRIRKLAYGRSEEQARELFGEFTIQVHQTQSEVRIQGERPGRRWPAQFRNFNVEYEITVPPNFGADVETWAGDIEVEGPVRTLRAVTAGGNIQAGDVGGETLVKTMGGSITLGNSAGPVQAQTAGGDIQVGDVRGSATLETRGGEIVAGRVEGPVRAITAGGDIQITGASGDVFAQTAGGGITVGEAGGRVQAETAGGRIYVRSAAGGVEAQTAGGEIALEQIRAGVRAVTVAGNIVARILGDGKGAGKLASESSLRTSFGDVEVYLLPELAITLDATIEMSMGHRIHTDFPLKIEGASTDYAFGPSRVRGFGELNGGGQLLKIYTVGGDIVIRKLTERVRERLQEREVHRWKRPAEKPRRPPQLPPSPP